jgi:RNA polymerase sigma factor (sigma-70 family)
MQVLEPGLRTGPGTGPGPGPGRLAPKTKLVAFHGVKLIEDLVIKAAAGDEASWSELVDRFAGLVWSVARSVGLSEADTADVSQTTWMCFAEHLDGLRDKSRVGPWLATTARREAIRVAQLGVRQVPVDPWGWLDQPDLRVNPEEAAMEQSRALSVHAAVAMLPARCRQLIWALVGDPPATYEELSRDLEMPVGSIGPTRSRCLERVARLMEEWDSEPLDSSTISERTSR